MDADLELDILEGLEVFRLRQRDCADWKIKVLQSKFEAYRLRKTGLKFREIAEIQKQSIPRARGKVRYIEWLKSMRLQKAFGFKLSCKYISECI